MRTIASQFIGLKNFDMVKKCIRQTMLYYTVSMLLYTAVMFVVKDAILGFFFVDESVKRASESTMTIFTFDLFIRPFVYVVSGTLR